MSRTLLPDVFERRMRGLLQEEAAAFFMSYEAPRCNGLRVNTRKVSPEDFVRLAPFSLERVPWTENGFYVDHRERPGQHPLYRAGLYYLQEPSAMAPAALLGVQPGERVLDLCAAPGGKATELGARLKGEGLLVANEISASRAKALLRNIEAFGIPNAVVTNTTADRLAERFPAYFDRVLVDAHCSGEGMFRKDPDAAAAWSPDKPARCAAVQRDLVMRAADMLRPGGTLVYSTCTFAPEEDEWVLVHLLRERPDMELVPIPLTDGREDFARAFTPQELRKRGFPDPKTAHVPEEAVFHTEHAVRIWPHRVRGEGHFVALLRRKESVTADSAAHDSHAAFSERTLDCAAHQMQQYGKKQGAEKRGASGNRSDRRMTSGKVMPGRAKLGKAMCGKAMSGKSATGKRAPALPAAQRTWVEPYFSMLSPGSAIDPARLQVHAGQVFLNPDGVPDLRGIPFLRSGLRLGELKKDRFEPGQELALAVQAEQTKQAEQAKQANGGNAIALHRISFSLQDPALPAYLRGETVRPEQAAGQGWCLVCAGDYPVGWGKLSDGVLKNKYPASWRVDLHGGV